MRVFETMESPGIKAEQHCFLLEKGNCEVHYNKLLWNTYIVRHIYADRSDSIVNNYLIIVLRGP